MNSLETTDNKSSEEPVTSLNITPVPNGQPVGKNVTDGEVFNGKTTAPAGDSAGVLGSKELFNGAVSEKIIFSDEQLTQMSKEELITAWTRQSGYIDSLEAKINHLESSTVSTTKEWKEKLLESTRRENLLILKVSSKERQIQQLTQQLNDLRKSLVPSENQLKSTLLDPAVNLLFDRMKKEVSEAKSKVEEMQNELAAWKFTPDSNTGKRLMAKCRLLYQENEELGKMISSGKIAKLEGELELQKQFSEDIKRSQSEIDEFLVELDEDFEGMQSTIVNLQQQLKESKENQRQLQSKLDKLGSGHSISIDQATHDQGADVTSVIEDEKDRGKDTHNLGTGDSVKVESNCDQAPMDKVSKESQSTGDQVTSNELMDTQ